MTHKVRLAVCTSIFGLIAGCAQTLSTSSANSVSQEARTQTSVSATRELEPTRQDGANMAVVALHPTQTDKSVILGTDELGGLDIYALSGTRLGGVSAGDVESIDIRYNVPINNSSVTLVSVLDSQSNALRFFSFDAIANTFQDISGPDITVGFAAEGTCLFQNPRDGNLYAFITGGGGEVEQWLLYDNAQGRIEGRLTRQLNLISEAGYCVANDTSGDLYIAEEAVGIWRFAADPEAITVPEIIDVVKFGNIEEEVGGLSLIQNANGPDHLLVSNASSNSFNLYNIDDDHSFVGDFTVTGNNASDGIEEAGGLYALNMPAGRAFPNGLVVVTDDDNGEESTNYKLVSLSDISSSVGTNFGSSFDPRLPVPASIASVQSFVETNPVSSHGDAADDPAIWVHPKNPELSTIIATEKQSGLYVYDLSGNVIQYLPDGKMNNVDIRGGFKLGGKEVSLVTASNRTTDSISIYAVDPKSRKLYNVADGIIDSMMSDPYGLCMYHSPVSGEYSVIINDTDGKVKQWTLSESQPGKVTATLAREFALESQTEGCVADDEKGDLYIGEEDVGVWKYGAEPNGGDARTAVAMASDHDALTVDVEGISLYYGNNGSGYLVVSSQGSDSYALFQRNSPHEYVGTFAVVANAKKGIDGISETDGLDVISTPLGKSFPKGIFIAQDGRNILPDENQNFKIVSWEDIETTLQLD